MLLMLHVFLFYMAVRIISTVIKDIIATIVLNQSKHAHYHTKIHTLYIKANLNIN